MVRAWGRPPLSLVAAIAVLLLLIPAAEVLAGQGDAPAEPTETDRYTFDGQIEAQVTRTFGSAFAPQGHTFAVPAGAQEIRVELTWTGSGDLDPVLVSPDHCDEEDQQPEPVLDGGFCRVLSSAAGTGVLDDGFFRAEGGTPAMPDSPATLVVEEATLEVENLCQEGPPCAWDLRIWANGAAIDVGYVAVVEVLSS